MNENKYELGYTKIFGKVMKKYGLTPNEYMLVDLISRLSQKKGYCWASRDWLAGEIGVTRQGLHKMVQRMVEKGMLFRTKGAKLMSKDSWSEETNGIVCKQSLQNDSTTNDLDVNLVKKDVNLVDKNVNSVDMKRQQSLLNISNTLVKHNEDNNSKGDWNQVKDFYTETLTRLMTVPPVLDGRFWSKFTKMVKPAFDTWGKDKTILALKGFFEDPWVQEKKYPISSFGDNPNKYMDTGKYNPKVGLGVNEYLERNAKLVDEAKARATSEGLPEDLSEDVQKVR